MQIETVSYTISWRKFRRGYSFFVPCIDHNEAKRTIFAATKRVGIDVVMKVVVEDGIKGLRVWRV